MVNELMKPKEENDRALITCYEMAEVLCTSVLAIALLFTFLARFAGVMGDSMLPTLHDKDWLAVTAYVANPNRGDVIIISPRTNSFHEPLVKRVIAVAGEEVDLRDGKVYVNNQPIEEPYLAADTQTLPANKHQANAAFPITVPEGRVFVLGDNRGGSADSRFSSVGFIRVDDILGRVVFRMFPFYTKDPSFRFTFGVK